MYLLADDRDENSFKKLSFGGFPKRDILTAIRREILKSDPVTTARWVAEAHASGWISELFDVYEQIAIEDIGIGNPRIFPYIQERREVIRQSIQGKNSFLETRNDGTVRYVLLEIAMIMLSSQKRSLGKLTRLKERDLGSEECFRKLRCYEEKHVDSVWDEEKDPKNLKGVYNELFGALQRKDLDLSIYWLSWLRMWELTGSPTPSGDAPEECPVTLHGWFGWKVWKYILTPEVIKPGLVVILNSMSRRDIRGGRKKFREECLLLAIISICETLDYSRPLTEDTGLIMRRSNATVTDRVYREMVENIV